MKNLGIPYAIGYLIAGLVVVPFLIFIVNKLFFQGNNAEKYIYQYLDNSKNIMMHLDPKVKTDYDFEIKNVFLSKSAGKFYLESETFYSKENKRYFQLRTANIGKLFFDAFRNHIEKHGFIATVNKDDMENPLYGTKQNPIPIFKVVGDGKPITINSTDKNGLTT
ncbi:hypothetical protein OIU83_23530, partial [Flavobacterium sp. LS1R49]